MALRSRGSARELQAIGFAADVEIAAALSGSTFASEPREDIARWKWGKLLMNLGNAVEAVYRRDARAGELASAARREGWFKALHFHS